MRVKNIIERAEDEMREAQEIALRAKVWLNMTPQTMRLRCGELTPGEIRAIRAVLKHIVGSPDNAPPTL